VAFYAIDVPCPACGTRLPVRVADNLNAERMTDARRWVLDRSLFQGACSCGTRFTAVHPFLYVDFERGLWIHVMPEDKRPEYHGREPEVVDAFHTAFDTERGPRFVASLAALVTPRLVYGYEELREKVVGADAGLDDAVVEALKLEILALRPELAEGGVMLLTLEAADAELLTFRSHGFGSDGAGEILGELTVARALYDKLAEPETGMRHSYPGLFGATYVNIQRYRFEPPALMHDPHVARRIAP
jgi:hypothetical protein